LCQRPAGLHWLLGSAVLVGEPPEVLAALRALVIAQGPTVGSLRLLNGRTCGAIVVDGPVACAVIVGLGTPGASDPPTDCSSAAEFARWALWVLDGLPGDADRANAEPAPADGPAESAADAGRPGADRDGGV